MNSVIRKSVAAVILDVPENLTDIGIFLSPKGVACLLNELADFRAVRLPWWHALSAQQSQVINGTRPWALDDMFRPCVQLHMEQTFNSVRGRGENVTQII
jgi:hypothetical protein